MGNLPDNFKTGITGAELLKVGTQVAEDAGFKLPDDWQYYSRNNEWSYCTNPGAIFADWTYRINPDRLKKFELFRVLTRTPNTDTGWMAVWSLDKNCMEDVESGKALSDVFEVELTPAGVLEFIKQIDPCVDNDED